MIYFLKPADYPLMLIGGMDEVVEARTSIAKQGGEPRIADLNWDGFPVRSLPWIHRRLRKMELIGQVDEPADRARYWRELSGPGKWLPGLVWVYADRVFLEKIRAAVGPCRDNNVRLKLGVKPVPRREAYQEYGRRLVDALNPEPDLNRSAPRSPGPSPGPVQRKPQ